MGGNRKLTLDIKELSSTRKVIIFRRQEIQEKLENWRRRPRVFDVTYRIRLSTALSNTSALL
jgi:hypothetical protein